MRVSEAIAKADALRPNALPMQMKAAWLYELDGEFAEVMGVDPPENHWPKEDEVLLMPRPYDGVYVSYLCAQIDIGLEEMESYQNDAAAYNQAAAEARAWWRRHHAVNEKRRFRVM